MKVEKMILIAFFGNYLVNNVAAGLASLVPAAQATPPDVLTQLEQIMSAQYITFAVLAAITTGIMAWWYLKRMSGADLMKGLIFGAVGFVVAVLTAFVTGIAGVLLQGGSFADVAQILPRFGPYLFQWTTLILLVVWAVPGALVGMLIQRRMGSSMDQSVGM